MLMQLVTILSYFAIPAALVCGVDDWFLRPRRQLAAAPRVISDPPLLSALYYILPILVGAGVIRMLVSERLDFSLVLVLIAAITGAIWLVEVLVFRPHRNGAARAQGKDPATVREPGTVDYARSFFPVAIVVLVLRSFVFEPFRIPSDSMMPTLLDGDFIIVNKFAYGLRLPVINRKFLSVKEPERGDVVVFRYPRDPSINYIKRLVGLPGDHVQVREDRLFVNGKAVPFTEEGEYGGDSCYIHMRIATEHLGSHTHQSIYCPVPLEIRGQAPSGCNRSEARGYFCGVDDMSSGMGDMGAADLQVPPGRYLMIGDNRDNSEDGRVWGFVPEDHLVGKATRIWFNWDLHRTGGPAWGRIGKRID